MTNTIPWPSELPEWGELDTWLARTPAALPVPRPLPAPRPAYVRSSLPTPILALDVDGPLNPWLGCHAHLHASGFELQRDWQSRVTYNPGTWSPYRQLWLSRVLGDKLAAFSRDHDVELVWATIWEHNANAVIAPAMGLPRLPWVDFSGHVSRRQKVWKWSAVADYAAGRPLAWLDDGFGSARHVRGRDAFRAARRNLPTLLVDVAPEVGLLDAHLSEIADWVALARLAW